MGLTPLTVEKHVFNQPRRRKKTWVGEDDSDRSSSRSSSNRRGGRHDYMMGSIGSGTVPQNRDHSADESSSLINEQLENLDNKDLIKIPSSTSPPIAGTLSVGRGQRRLRFEE